MAQLYFYYSAMNAGKSTALLQSSYNYQERGMRTLVFTAEIDHRYGVGKVSSRIGLSSQAQLYNNDSMLFAMIQQEHQQQQVHCVLLDESQFLTKAQVEQLCDVVDQLTFPYCVTACAPIFSVSCLPVANICWPGPISWWN